MPVLIADDSPNMRKMLKNALRQFGVERIDEAEDGRAALGLMKQHAYGLVLLDWNMPAMTGIEVLRFMRADDSLRDIPVMMLTAEADKKNVLEAMGAGVTDYLIKPFTMDALKSKIDRIARIPL